MIPKLISCLNHECQQVRDASIACLESVRKCILGAEELKDTFGQIIYAEQYSKLRFLENTIAVEVLDDILAKKSEFSSDKKAIYAFFREYLKLTELTRKKKPKNVRVPKWYYPKYFSNIQLFVVLS
jgi:hypothetical protein